MTEKNWCVWCGTYLESTWPIGKDGLPDRWATLTCPQCGRETGFDSGRKIPPYDGTGVPLRCPRCQYVHNLNLVGNIYGLNPPLPCPQCGFDLRAPYDPNEQPGTQPVKSSPAPVPPKEENFSLTRPDLIDPTATPQPAQAEKQNNYDPDIILGNWRGIHDGRKAADDNSIIAFVKREGEYRYVGILKQVGNVLKGAKFSILEEMCWFNPTEKAGVYNGYLKRRKHSTGEPQVNPFTARMLTPDRVESVDKLGSIYSIRITDPIPQPRMTANGNMRSDLRSPPPGKDLLVPPSRSTPPLEPLYPIPEFSRSKSSSEVMIKAFGWAIGIMLLTISTILGIMLGRILFNTQYFGLLPNLNEVPLYPLLFLQFSPTALMILITSSYIIPPIWKKLTWQYSQKGCARWVVIPIKILTYLWILVVIGLLLMVYLGYNVSELLVSGII